MNELLDWVATQGFAIAIAIYLLTRLEQKVDRLITVIEDLSKKIGN